MKNRSTLIIGFAIIVGFTILGLFILIAFDKDSSNTGSNINENRFELVPANQNNLILFDKKTGEYWNKFIPSTEGLTNWQKGDSPIKNSNK